ncbi:MAG: zinc finger Ran-binding domain-containing protein [Candidatus Limnocylindria bacterium]
MGEALDLFLTYVLSYGGGMLLGAAVIALLAALVRSAARSVARARGSDRPDWASGIWLCAGCRSTNTAVARSCQICGSPRQEVPRPPVEPLEDVVPERIPVPPGAAVTLRHDPAAHVDPTTPHWRIQVADRTVGSAARRDGVRALLRALDGAPTVLLDVRGVGAVAYRTDDVIRRFDGSRFPLEVPCPEAATWALPA